VSPPTVAFEVFTDPAPQGSKTTGARKNGTRYTREDNPRTKPFRIAVREAATEAWQGRPPLNGPVELQVICYQRRLTGHFGTGRNAQRLKPSAPSFKATSPDLDKICRAVCDALTGVAFVDDGRVWVERLHTIKVA
jgi:Holliday junction resolvase RusA-like endonuclease